MLYPVCLIRTKTCKTTCCGLMRACEPDYFLDLCDYSLFFYKLYSFLPVWCLEELNFWGQLLYLFTWTNFFFSSSSLGLSWLLPSSWSSLLSMQVSYSPFLRFLYKLSCQSSGTQWTPLHMQTRFPSAFYQSLQDLARYKRLLELESKIPGWLRLGHLNALLCWFRVLYAEGWEWK